jgi:hypothetical protein
LRLTGPEALRPAEQVAIVARATGRPMRFQPQPQDQARQEMREIIPEPFVDAIFRFFAERVTTTTATSTPRFRDCWLDQPGRSPPGPPATPTVFAEPLVRIGIARIKCLVWSRRSVVIDGLSQPLRPLN